MANALPDLVGKVRLDTSELDAVGTKTSNLSANLGKLGKGMALAFGGAVVAGVAGFGAALVQGAKDAASYEQITDQLAQTLKSTGGAAGVSVEGLKQYAGQLESISGVDEELILSSQNVLATFTNIKDGVGANNKIFSEASAAALNLSTTMGGDLQGAAVLVGKALNDPIKGVSALSRAGVQLTQAQKDSVKAMVEAGDAAGAQRIILGELETQFGGAAAAAGAGLTGSLARAKDAFGDIFRELGERLLPKLTEAAEWFADELPGAFAKGEAFIKNNVLPALKSLSDFWATNGPTIVAAVRTAADGVVAALKTVSDAVRGVVGFFREHDTAAKALGAVVAVVMAGVAAAWVAQAAVAAINAAKSVAAWVATAAASTTSSTIQSKSTAQIVAGWAIQAAKATLHAAKVVLGWVATAAGAVAAGVVMAAQAALMVAKWVVMGAAAMVNAAIIAGAWLIALGPVGLVIAGVAAVVAIFAVAWKSSETFRDVITAALGVAQRGVGDAVGFIIQGFRGLLTVWLTVADGIVSGAATALGWIPGLGPKLKQANTAFDNMKTGILATLDDAAQKAHGFGQDVPKQVATGVKKTQAQAVSAAAGLEGNVSGKLQAIRSAAYESGQNAGQGLANGLDAMAGAVAAAAQRLAITAGRAMASGLQERSPSRVTRRIGEYAGEGLELGLLDMRRQVADAARVLAVAAAPDVDVNGLSGSAYGAARASLPQQRTPTAADTSRPLLGGMTDLLGEQLAELRNLRSEIQRQTERHLLLARTQEVRVGG